MRASLHLIHRCGITRRLCHKHSMSENLRSNFSATSTDGPRHSLNARPGIQPRGILLVLDEDCNVSNASVNLAAELEASLQSILRKPVEQVLGESQGARLRKMLSNEEMTVEPTYLLTCTLPSQRPMHLVAHRHEGVTFIELEPTGAATDCAQLIGVHKRVRAHNRRMEAAGAIQGLHQIIADSVRDLSGFGRVMVYQLEPDGNGRVVGESLDPHRSIDSYLGQTFPGNDLLGEPPEGSLLNGMRLIADVNDQPCPVEPRDNPRTNRPLDLSFADLRSASQAQLESLRSMQVCASLSIAVMTEGRLWGYIVCHHDRDRFLPYELRSTCGDLVQMFAMQLATRSQMKMEALGKLNSELAASNRDLEAFAYSVSHDLRAPFRHIVGYSDLLRRRSGDKLDPTSVHYLDSITDAARYAGTMVDSLLAFSQISRRKLALDRIDLNQTFGEVRLELEQLGGGDRTIHWSIARLPEVRADAVMLRLVVRNLLSNAMKFTRPREIADISVGSLEHPDEHVIFIRDNGVGFDMTYKNKLFGVFQRLHTAEEFEGTGIGLANVKRIIERHGGRVWAESVLDRGATFYFTLLREPGR